MPLDKPYLISNTPGKQFKIGGHDHILQRADILNTNYTISQKWRPFLYECYACICDQMLELSNQ